MPSQLAAADSAEIDRVDKGAISVHARKGSPLLLLEPLRILDDLDGAGHRLFHGASVAHRIFWVRPYASGRAGQVSEFNDS